MKKIKSILYNSFLVMSFLCIGSFMFTLVKNDFNVNKTSIFGYKIACVASASMEPTLMTNQSLLTKTTTFDEVEVGDVIVYEYKNILIIHRVVAKYDDYLKTKGDNNEGVDSWKVYPENVLFKTVKDF